MPGLGLAVCLVMLNSSLLLAGMIDLVKIANAFGHKDPKTTAQVYINHDEQDLIVFATAVEQAVEAGYKKAMSEEVKLDLESCLAS